MTSLTGMDLYLLLAAGCAVLVIMLLLMVVTGQIRIRERSAHLDAKLEAQTLQVSMTLESANETREMLERRLGEDRERIEGALARQREALDKRQLQALRTMHRTLQGGMGEVRRQVNEALLHNAEVVGRQVEGLGEIVDRRLGEIGAQVERRLAEGFEKTNATFGDITRRLALIDEAQRRITELSANVVGLQEILADKRSRGVFGEIQLESLVRNAMPEAAFSLQHTLSNGNRADCVLFLPPPTGNVVVDAKFPLEAYRRMTDSEASAPDRKAATRDFRLDIRRHLQAIASKYLIPGETADGAVMFIPAEAVFAEIHAHHPGLVDEAHEARVWMTSPATLMAILTTARAVLRDEATQRQAHLIRKHLDSLGADFERFRNRMNNLARHIGQAHQDVEAVNASARNITRRFSRIEKVELDSDSES